MKSPLICPLLSTGRKIDMVCIKERCAWYQTQTDCCSMLLSALAASEPKPYTNMQRPEN